MLAFTNRIVDTNHNGAEAFTTTHRPGLDALSSATVSAAPAGGWQLDNITPDLGDDQAVMQLVPLLRGDAPVLVHVHGCFNPPSVCFERGRLLETTYGVRVVLFSWPSEGLTKDGTDGASPAPDPDDEFSLAKVEAGSKNKGGVVGIVRRYRQARANAKSAAPALARLLRLVATARLFANQHPFSVSTHSLGGELMQHTVAESGALEALGAARNVVLIAPCATAQGHKAWVSLLRPKGRVFLTYNDADAVLWGARIADGEDIKLGTDPGSDRVANDQMRYVSFTGYQVGAFGHTYFALEKMPKAALKVFRRLLGSAPDLQPDEVPRKVYPMGCDADGLTCFMGKDKPVVEPG